MAKLKSQILRRCLVDPQSGDYSMSRLCSCLLTICVCLIDICVVGYLLAGKFKDAWFAPLATLNVGVAVAAFGAYGLNSFGRTLGYGRRVIMSRLPIPDNPDK